jgi:hypothetical protein
VIVVSPQPPEETLSASVTVRLTADEKASLQAKAKSLGVSMSALVRHWVQQNL